MYLSLIIYFISHGGPYFEDNFISVDSFVATADAIIRESCIKTKNLQSDSYQKYLNTQAETYNPQHSAQ